MEKSYVIVEKEELKDSEEAGEIPYRLLTWIFKNIKFLLLPGSRLEELTFREIEYEKAATKRHLVKRLKNPLTVLGFCIIFVIITLAVFAPWLSPQSMQQAMIPQVGSWNPPSPEHPLGQTAMGGDVLSRLIWGARTSLTIALPSLTLSVVGGVLLGVLAAYYGGWVDLLIMRICDIFLAFPGLILALVFIAIYGPFLEMILLIYGFLGIPFYARLIRGNVLLTKNLPYINAAVTSGAGNWRIMFKHILPNVIQPIIISVTFNLGTVILGLAGLSFLGVNQSITIEWGNDINIARENPYEASWAGLWPGLMIFLTVLGFMLVGDGLRDALDPRLKNI
jgi:peptide/nickel transport system permease protein